MSSIELNRGNVVWGGIEIKYGTGSIADTWLLNTGSFEAEPGVYSAFIIRNGAFLSFSGDETVVDSIGYGMYQEATDCNSSWPLPYIVNTVGYQECQSYCKDISTDTGDCI